MSIMMDSRKAGRTFSPRWKHFVKSGGWNDGTQRYRRINIFQFREKQICGRGLF